MPHLEGEEAAVVADDWVRSFVVRIVTEMGEPDIVAASVEREPPEIDVARAEVILAIALHQRVLAIGVNAFGLIVFVGRVGVLGDFLRRQVDAADVRRLALLGVGAERELALSRAGESFEFPSCTRTASRCSLRIGC